MSSKTITALILLSMTVAVPAYAGSTAQAHSQSGSTAYSNGNTVSSSLTSGMSNTTVISAARPTHIPVGVPGVVTAPVVTPQLFGARGQPTVVRGVPLTLQYMKSCQPVATRKHPLLDVFATGESGKTQVVFSPNQVYYSAREKTSKSYSDDNYNQPKFQPVETARVSFTRSGKYNCLGIVTVTAKKGVQIPLSTVLSDSRYYALMEMKGFKNVYLLSVPEAIAAAGGVRTSGSGFSVSPGIISTATNLLTAGTLSAGYSNSGGNTGATARLGTTFLVLSPTTSTTGIVLTQRMLRNYYR